MREKAGRREGRGGERGWKEGRGEGGRGESGDGRRERREVGE